MLTRKLKRFAMLTGSVLFAIDLSPCGPQGELLEALLPLVIGLAT